MADSLVVPAITAVGIVIAMGQFLLARQRLRLDLYDRRYKIFDSARRLIIEILREGFADRAVVFAYRWETGDAVFLLGKDVVSYLGEVEKRAFRFVYIRTILATEGHPNRETAIDEEAELLNWFAEQYDVLVQKFKPSLK